MASASPLDPTEKAGHRLSVSVSPDQYDELIEMARRNRVSIAWVVREAIERLLKDDTPLFHFRNPG